MDLHSQLATMEAQAKEVEFRVKKVKVCTNESLVEVNKKNMKMLK
jgi:hypothetical protein